MPSCLRTGTRGAPVRHERSNAFAVAVFDAVRHDAGRALLARPARASLDFAGFCA
jgi:hypothetical protein